jgi:tRNA A37 threonylcarbamoyltransferase TsaD
MSDVTQLTGMVLGIERSCDDTGCAIVDSNGKLLGEAMNSQQVIKLFVASSLYM